MTSAGSPDEQSWKFPWLLILLAVILVLALVIGTQVIGVLVAILAPPEPPVPADAQQLSHSSQEQGVDEWVYGSDTNACEIVNFYRENNGVCVVDPVWCFDDQNLAPRAGSGWQPVATCSADVTFSIFVMRWYAEISAGHADGGQTHIELSREISWSGSLPPENP
jgi:hypothetical protein